MLVVKTGMPAEYTVAKHYAAPDVLVLTGLRSFRELNDHLPDATSAIISFGTCGGLSPETKVGDVYVCSHLRTRHGRYVPDWAWQRRLMNVGRLPGAAWFSSSVMNLADNEIQRKFLFAKTQAAVIDDETWAVAQVAAFRNIEFAAMRVVSDGGLDNLPPAVKTALNVDGTVDYWAVLESIAKDPGQIPALIETAFNYRKAMDALTVACKNVGPYFQWRGSK